MTKFTETLPLSEAKAKLSESIRKVEAGQTVLITRHGRPVAALVPIDDAARVERLRAAGPEGGLASVAGGWADSDELVQRIRETARSNPRTVRALD